MSGGTSEVHKDTEPLITGTHEGSADATDLEDRDADFRGNGVRVGLAAEHVTKGYYGTVSAVTHTTVSITWESDGAGTPITFGSETLWFGDTQVHFEEASVWDYGDTYKIYKTASKGSIISTNWVDISRGWKSRKADLQRGWRAEDIDIDRDNPGKVFGPGQPERAR
jgi:hypothetical protein